MGITTKGQGFAVGSQIGTDQNTIVSGVKIASGAHAGRSMTLDAISGATGRTKEKLMANTNSKTPTVNHNTIINPRNNVSEETRFKQARYIG